MAKKRAGQKGRTPSPQSSELAGGMGFTFGDAVSASFLAALLSEGYAPGVVNATVSRVALEQRNFGEPLDDIIIDYRDRSGTSPRMRLQAKKSLTISAAPSNTDIREIIRDSWATLHLGHFRKGVDRYGAAVSQIAKDKARDLISLCEFARESQTTEHFGARFVEGGNASATVKAIKHETVSLLSEAKGVECSQAEIHEFLSHFVLLEFDFLHEGASQCTLRSATRFRPGDGFAPGQGTSSARNAAAP